MAHNRRHSRAVKRKGTPSPKKRGARGDHGHGSRANRSRTKQVTASKRAALQPSRELDSSNAKSNNNPFGVVGRARKKKKGS